MLKPGPVGIVFGPVLPEPNGVTISKVLSNSQIGSHVAVGNKLLKVNKVRVDHWPIDKVTQEVRRTSDHPDRTMVFEEEASGSSSSPSSSPSRSSMPLSPSNPFA